jgi:hypothetical protein
VLAGTACGCVGTAAAGQLVVVHACRAAEFENTGWDLVFNLLGATAGSAWLARASVPGAAQGTRCKSGAVPQL